MILSSWRRAKRAAKTKGKVYRSSIVRAEALTYRSRKGFYKGLRCVCPALFPNDLDEDAVRQFPPEQVDDAVLHIAFEDLSSRFGV